MVYTLYNADQITTLPTPQPTGSTWELVPRGQFANGVQRFALGKKVIWTFAQEISPAQYQQLVVAQQAGRQKIITWKGPEGGVAGQFVAATALMQRVVPGILQDGAAYTGVSVTFVDVREA